MSARIRITSDRPRDRRGSCVERLAALLGFAAIAAVTVVSAGAGLVDRRPVDEIDRALTDPTQFGELLRAWRTDVEAVPVNLDGGPE